MICHMRKLLEYGGNPTPNILIKEAAPRQNDVYGRPVELDIGMNDHELVKSHFQNDAETNTIY